MKNPLLNFITQISEEKYSKMINNDLIQIKNKHKLLLIKQKMLIDQLTKINKLNLINDS